MTSALHLHPLCCSWWCPQSVLSWLCDVRCLVLVVTVSLQYPCYELVCDGSYAANYRPEWDDVLFVYLRQTIEFWRCLCGGVKLSIFNPRSLWRGLGITCPRGHGFNIRVILLMKTRNYYQCCDQELNQIVCYYIVVCMMLNLTSLQCFIVFFFY